MAKRITVISLDPDDTTPRCLTAHDHTAGPDPVAADPTAPIRPTLRISTTGFTDSLDPVRYWSVFDGDRRIGRVCLICLPDHVGAVLGLWVEPGHGQEAAARRMLVDAAHRGLHRAACVKVIADASVAHEPAWRQIVARGSLTPRPVRNSRRWHDYYVNIYHPLHEIAIEAGGGRAHLLPPDGMSSQAGRGTRSGTPPSPGTGNIYPRSLGVSGFVRRLSP